MKLTQDIQSRFRGHDKREVFLWGFYVSFLIIMVLAMISDALIDNLIDAQIELVMIALTLLSFLYYRYNGSVHIAMNGIVLLSTLTTYAYILSNEFTVSIYHSIVPLGYFFLYALRTALLLTVLHNVIVLIFYAIGYHYHPEYLVYHHAEISIASALASLLIVFFGIVYHFAIENSYQMLSKSNFQKELLLKEVHHRVKNNLNIISSMLGLQILREDEPHVKDILTKNKHRIKSIAMVHEILYQHEDFAHINIHEYLERLAKTLLEVYDKEVQISMEGLHQELPFEQALRIGIIANEMIVNSIKYALNGQEPSIRMRIDEEKTHYIFQYEDSNAAPVKLTETQRSKSLGLRFIDMMVKQLDADLSVRSDAGLIYTLWIPKHAH